MQHKLLSNPNINIPLRWFLFRWIRRQSRLCTMESRSWKEKSSGWSRHFLRYFRARNRPFIPSFPPFSNEQRARYRAYPPPGGTGRGMDLYRRGCCWPTFSSMGDLPARWEAKPKGFGDGNPRFDLVPTFNSKRYRLAILVPSDIRVYFNFFQSWTRFY